jgi:predicted phage gp36 major capsid-like protein|tara:strand:- start:251 stop:508 length:258 start_codon:yes stop_codon:yes gene_type:complete
MEMIYDILLNAGPIGLLALYAIYSNSQSEKKIEMLLQQKEEKEEQIRNRWIAVVEKVQKERDDIEKDISRRLEHIEKILEKQHEK